MGRGTPEYARHTPKELPNVRWPQYVFYSHNTLAETTDRLLHLKACKMLHAWSSYWLRKRTLNYIFLLSPHRITLSVSNVIKEAKGCGLITGPLTWDKQQFVEDCRRGHLIKDGKALRRRTQRLAGAGVLGKPAQSTLVWCKHFQFTKPCSTTAIWSQLFGTWTHFYSP